MSSIMEAEPTQLSPMDGCVAIAVAGDEAPCLCEVTDESRAQAQVCRWRFVEVLAHHLAHWNVLFCESLFVTRLGGGPTTTAESTMIAFALDVLLASVVASGVVLLLEGCAVLGLHESPRSAACRAAIATFVGVCSIAFAAAQCAHAVLLAHDTPATVATTAVSSGECFRTITILWGIASGCLWRSYVARVSKLEGRKVDERQTGCVMV